MNTFDSGVIARELRSIRQSPPGTVGEALPRYAAALRNARRAGVDAPTVLLIGELLWCAIRPEEDPTPDAIGVELNAIWAKYDADIAFCARNGPPGERQHTPRTTQAPPEDSEKGERK